MYERSPNDRKARRTELRHMRAHILIALIAAPFVLNTSGAAKSPTPMVRIEGGTFESVLPPAPNQKSVDVRKFALDVTPVSNAQFAMFVKDHPEWQRDRVKKLFADASYLSHWRDATTPGDEIKDQPVTNVSWYAARAYCKSHGARLPTWYEWEFAAAASETQRDGRQDPAWRQRIL